MMEDMLFFTVLVLLCWSGLAHSRPAQRNGFRNTKYEPSNIGEFNKEFPTNGIGNAAQFDEGPIATGDQIKGYPLFWTFDDINDEEVIYEAPDLKLDKQVVFSDLPISILLDILMNSNVLAPIVEEDGYSANDPNDLSGLDDEESGQSIFHFEDNGITNIDENNNFGKSRGDKLSINMFSEDKLKEYDEIYVVLSNVEESAARIPDEDEMDSEDEESNATNNFEESPIYGLFLEYDWLLSYNISLRSY